MKKAQGYSWVICESDKLIEIFEKKGWLHEIDEFVNEDDSECENDDKPNNKLVIQPHEHTAFLQYQKDRPEFEAWKAIQENRREYEATIQYCNKMIALADSLKKSREESLAAYHKFNKEQALNEKESNFSNSEDESTESDVTSPTDEDILEAFGDSSKFTTFSFKTKAYLGRKNVPVFDV